MLRILLMTFAVLAATVWAIDSIRADEPTGLPSIKVGQPFPDLVFPSLDDRAPMRLSDFRGKRVLLHVFASW